MSKQLQNYKLVRLYGCRSITRYRFTDKNTDEHLQVITNATVYDKNVIQESSDVERVSESNLTTWVPSIRSIKPWRYINFLRMHLG